MAQKESGGVDPNPIAMAIQASTAIATSGKLDKTMAELDQGLSSVLSVVFAPFNAIAAGKELAKGLVKRVAAKLHDVPQEQKRLPAGSVSGPVLMSYVLLGESEDAEGELRDLYAGLLASAIDDQSASKAHPSFAHIIANMTAKEAKLFQALSEDNVDTWACIRVREKVFYPIKGLEQYGKNAPAETAFIPWGDYYDVPGPAVFDVAELGNAMLNLRRLGLIEIDFDATIHDEGAYERLANALTRYFSDESVAEKEFDFEHGLARVSLLGYSFADVCLR